jgi:hypothetical protein
VIFQFSADFTVFSRFLDFRVFLADFEFSVDFGFSGVSLGFRPIIGF